jgi:hypothetical protein
VSHWLFSSSKLRYFSKLIGAALLLLASLFAWLPSATAANANIVAAGYSNDSGANDVLTATSELAQSGESAVSRESLAAVTANRLIGHVYDAARGLVAPTSALDDVLPYPTVTDPKLQNYVDNLYKGTTNPHRVGTGTTADAVRNELTTGLPTGGTFHSTKAQETINGLTRWLRNNPDATYSDRLVAQSLLDDLVDALGTTP